MPEKAWITDLVGALCDPVIVMPGGWHESLPEWIFPRIKMERLLENMKAAQEDREPRATDAEIMAYLFTASLTTPFDETWTNIYLYISRKVIKAHLNQEIPLDIKVETLTETQSRHLEDLREFIMRSRVKHRKEKDREVRKEVQGLPVVAPKEQPALF